MFKLKKISVLSWVLAAVLFMSMIPTSTILAADDSSSTAVADTTQTEETTANSLEISNSTEDPVSVLTEAINTATQDLIIYLNADPADGETEVVYSFAEPLTIPENVSISINGKDGVEYVFQAEDEAACSDSISKTGSGSYPGFVNVNGSLTLHHVTIDANQNGRAVCVTGTFVMESGSIVENAKLEATGVSSSFGAGIYMSANSNVSVGDSCYIQYCTIYQTANAAYGAGIFAANYTSLSLESGSHVSSNLITATDNYSGNAYGAGVCFYYGMNSNTFYMEGCYIEYNQIINSSIAYGAGVYCLNGNGTEWTDVTVTGNNITHSGSSAAYGAGICCGSTASSCWIDGGTVSENTITGEASYARGAGIYIGTLNHKLLRR